MRFEIDYLAQHERFVPTVAQWQHAEFGYLNPADTLESRTGRLRNALQTELLPLAFIAVSDGELVGSAGILASTVTHRH